MSKGYWRDVSDVWTIPPAKNLGAPGNCVPGAPSIRISIRSADTSAVIRSTRRGPRSERPEALYFVIRPSSFMMASYSTIFFFTRAREASGPINSVLKPF